LLGCLDTPEQDPLTHSPLARVKGSPTDYTDAGIQVILTPKVLFKLTLRQAHGLLGNL